MATYARGLVGRLTASSLHSTWTAWRPSSATTRYRSIPAGIVLPQNVHVSSFSALPLLSIWVSSRLRRDGANYHLRGSDYEIARSAPVIVGSGRARCESCH